MLFQFLIHYTDEDYLAFMDFHTFGSKQANKRFRKNILKYILNTVLSIAAVLCLIEERSTAVTITVVLVVYTTVHLATFRKNYIRKLRRKLTQTGKDSKKPYDPISSMEFYEDKLVESTPTTRTAMKYEAIEQVCVVADQFVLLYSDKGQVYQIPAAQFTLQSNLDALIEFLSAKPSNIEFY